MVIILLRITFICIIVINDYKIRLNSDLSNLSVTMPCDASPAVLSCAPGSLIAFEAARPVQ